MISQITDTISWSNVSGAVVSTNDTFQISANGNLIVAVYTAASDMNSITGVAQPDGSISWGAPQTGFDHCKSDSSDKNMCSISMTPGRVALSFHVSSTFGSSALWGTLGRVDPVARSITWTSIDQSVVDDSGYEPAVAVNSSGGFVLVHRTDNRINGQDLYYRVGQLDANSGSITWGPKHDPYAAGYLPRIAIFDDVIVEVHQSRSSFSSLQIIIGQIDFKAGSITWQQPIQYSSGNRPTVSFDGTNIVEAHEAIDLSLTYSSYLACNRFTYSPANHTLQRPAHPDINIGYGNVPCVTAASIGSPSESAVILGCLNADNQVAGRDSFHTQDGTRFPSLSLTTMTGSLAPVKYGLHKGWLSKRYNEVTFPGTHNSYSNPFDGDGGGMAPGYSAFVRNNSLSVEAQLDLGIRCLVFEVHYETDPLPNAVPVLVYHGPFTIASMAFCYSFPISLCQKVKSWVAAHPKEIVTVYFDKQDDQVTVEWLQQICRAAELDQYVWDYITDASSQTWPTLQQMIDKGKTVMVIMPGFRGADGSQGKQFIAQNSYTSSDGTPQPAWNAKTVRDLSPSRLVAPVNPAKLPMFRDSNFCSRKAAGLDEGYSTAGNPFQAARANQYQVVYPLAKAIDTQLAQSGLNLNYIWADFADYNSYGLLQAAYQLNAERHVTAIPVPTKTPGGIAVDTYGNVYLVDVDGHQILKVDPAETITTVVGSDIIGYPTAVAYGNSKLFIGENHAIITAEGNPVAVVSSPAGIAMDAAGNLIVADLSTRNIIKVAPDGSQSVVISSLALPVGVAVDSAGNVYACDKTAGTVVKATSAGVQTVVSGLKPGGPAGIAVDPKGNLYIVNPSGNSVLRVGPSPGSAPQPVAQAAEIRKPSGIAVNAKGAVYVTGYDAAGASKVWVMWPSAAVARGASV